MAHLATCVVENELVILQDRQQRSGPPGPLASSDNKSYDYPTFEDGPRKVPQTPLLESDVQAKCVAWMRGRGWWARKFASDQNNSVPDYAFGKDTWVEWVEFKRPKAKGVARGELSKGQLEEHKKMRAAGMTPVVFDKVDDFKDYILNVEKIISNDQWRSIVDKRRFWVKEWERHE